MADYLYRRGDGNEGNFIKAMVTLKADESPYAALRALLVNDYISGKSRRRYIANRVEIDGDDINVHATVYEGPRGEQAFGAAWLTAELQLLDEKDSAYYADTGLAHGDLLDMLDKGAKQLFAKHNQI